MKKIKIAKKFTFVDDADYKHLKKWKWTFDGNYAARMENGKKIYMHREILKTPLGALTDHVDGNRLNNRRKNLRLCSDSQNSMNSKKRKFASSKYKGVSFKKDKNKWISYITVNKKQKFLGYFDCADSAAESYNKAAVKHFGEFSRLNKIAV